MGDSRVRPDVNVCWPGPSEMGQRHVYFDINYTTKSLGCFKSKVGPLLKVSTIPKFIMYSNTRASVNRVYPKLGDWIDSKGYKADMLMIIGTLLREQKFYHIRTFNSSNTAHASLLESSLEHSRPFNPQVLVATSGAANAGIDDPEVFGVTRMEFPPSLLDVKQEKGRAGRRPTASSTTDFYLMCFSLESYVVLLKRLHSTAGSRESVYFKHQDTEMQKCLEMFVLPQQCLQSSLEVALSNPFLLVPSPPPAPCGVACSYCAGTYDKLFPKLIKAGVRHILLQLFLGESPFDKRPTLEKDFVDAVRKFPRSNSLLFGSKSGKKPSEPVLVKKMTMMLLAARILKYSAVRKDSAAVAVVATAS